MSVRARRRAGPAGLALRLTLTYVLVTATAIGVFGLLAIRSDGAARDARLDGRLEVRALAAAGLAYFDGGELHLDDLRADEVGSGSPQVVLLLGAPPRRPVFTSARPPLAVAAEQLQPAAAAAASTEEVSRAAAADISGHPVRVLAAPFYDEAGAPAGAVVAIADPGPDRSEHRRLVLAIVLAAAGALLVVGFGTFLLIARRLPAGPSAAGAGRGGAGPAGGGPGRAGPDGSDADVVPPRE